MEQALILVEQDIKIGGPDNEAINYQRVRLRAKAAAKALDLVIGSVDSETDEQIAEGGLKDEDLLIDRGVSLDWLYRGDCHALARGLARHWEGTEACSGGSTSAP